jgi:O-methyltransferase
MGAAVDPVTQLRDLYLDLLERALTHTLYAGADVVEPPEDVKREWWNALAGTKEAALIFDPERTRREGRDWPRFAQTMVGVERLHNVRACVETVLVEDVAGDLIETGAWRGGVGIMIRGVLAAYDDRRRSVWLADSFEGLPTPDPEAYPADAGDRSHERQHLAVSADEARDHFRRYGLLDDRVHLVEGWFRDTLPALRGHPWSLIRLDGDMYESTKVALDNLYAGLSPGGFVIVDDFALPACREAVEDFRREQGVDDPIARIDWTGVYWRKSG